MQGMTTQKLPPLNTPRAHSLADRVDEDNPFENSWTILKSLKTEVRELQAAVRAEQHMRESEVNDLKKEVQHLREELAREKAERKADTKSVVDPVSGACNQLHLELRKVKAMREQQLTELRESLDDERKARESGFGGLAGRLAEEESTRTKCVSSLTECLNETRRLLDATGTDARQNIHNLVQDVKTLSDHLLRVTNTWQGLRSDSLLSYHHHVSNTQNPRTASTSMPHPAVPAAPGASWSA